MCSAACLRQGNAYAVRRAKQALCKHQSCQPRRLQAALQRGAAVVDLLLPYPCSTKTGAQLALDRSTAKLVSQVQEWEHQNATHFGHVAKACETIAAAIGLPALAGEICRHAGRQMQLWRAYCWSVTCTCSRTAEVSLVTGQHLTRVHPCASRRQPAHPQPGVHLPGGRRGGPGPAPRYCGAGHGCCTLEVEVQQAPLLCSINVAVEGCTVPHPSLPSPPVTSPLSSIQASGQLDSNGHTMCFTFPPRPAGEPADWSKPGIQLTCKKEPLCDQCRALQVSAHWIWAGARLTVNRCGWLVSYAYPLSTVRHAPITSPVPCLSLFSGVSCGPGAAGVHLPPAGGPGHL